MKKLYKKPVVVAKEVRAASMSACGRWSGSCGDLVRSS